MVNLFVRSVAVCCFVVAGACAAPGEPGPVDPTPADPYAPSFGSQFWVPGPDQPVEDPPGEGWCEQVPVSNPGLPELPATALALLESGFTIDPATVTCPDPSFERWPPFVRRHTSTYTSTRRWGGFNECVPQIDLEGRYNGVYITHTPLVTASYGVARYGDILRGVHQDAGWTSDPVIAAECPDPVANVLDQAQWLDENAISRPYRGVETWAWGYDFINLQGKLEAPWTSAYAQALVATAYMAAFCVSDDPHWLGGAEKALLNMLVPMPDGGVGTWESEDAVWFEEAATDLADSARSLNGHIGALAAVHTVADWTGNEDIGTLAEYGLAAPLREIEKYDAKFISLYTQWAIDYPFIAPKHDYNRFHVQQLSWIYTVTGDSRAMDMALRFARYDDPGWDVTLSPTVSGTEEFWHNWEYFPQWWTAAPGWMLAELTRNQVVDGITLWSPDPERIETGETIRPGSVDIDLSSDGVFWTTYTREWPDECNDAVLEIPPTDARFVKVWLHSPNREEQPNVGLQAFGVHRAARHPAGVSFWLLHGVLNRPSEAFSDEGFVFGRSGWQIYDLDGAFPTGFELLFEGWRGPDDPIPMLPWPTITTADDLDGPWTELPIEGRMIGPYLAYQLLGDPGFRYMKVDVQTNFAPLAPARILIRNL